MGYLGFSSLGFLLSNIRQVTLRIGSELEGERSKIEKETVVTTIIIRTPSLNIYSYPFSCFLFADAPVLLFLWFETLESDPERLRDSAPSDIELLRLERLFVRPALPPPPSVADSSLVLIAGELGAFPSNSSRKSFKKKGDLCFFMIAIVFDFTWNFFSSDRNLSSLCPFSVSCPWIERGSPNAGLDSYTCFIFIKPSLAAVSWQI